MSAEVEDPKVLLDGHIWPESIYVRWYREKVEQLISDYDIVCLLETWLARQQEEELKALRKDFNAVSTSHYDDSLYRTAGRKKERVVILWSNKFYKFITPHKYDYDWVVSIEIVSDTKNMFVFNVSLPYDKKYNEEEYLDPLKKLHNLLAECDSTWVTVVGD